MLHQDKVCVIPKDANGPGSKGALFATRSCRIGSSSSWFGIRILNGGWLCGYILTHFWVPEKFGTEFLYSSGCLGKKLHGAFFFGGLDVLLHEDPHVLTKSGGQPNHPSISHRSVAPAEILCSVTLPR
jgi:hypothetical protein